MRGTKLIVSTRIQKTLPPEKGPNRLACKLRYRPSARTVEANSVGRMRAIQRARQSFEAGRTSACATDVATLKQRPAGRAISAARPLGTKHAGDRHEHGHEPLQEAGIGIADQGLAESPEE